MSKKARHFLVCGIVFVFCFVSSNAQNRSTISGYVFDTNRNPIGQIVVELLNEFNGVIGRTRTDSGGKFYFSGLGHGRFIIRVLPLGTDLMEQSADVELFGTGNGPVRADNVQKDFYLKDRRSTNTIPSKNAVIYAQEVPKEAETLFKDAVSDINSGRLETGTASLEKAIAIFPTYFSALQQLGVIRVSQGKFEVAIDLFKRALAVNDRGSDSWYGLAHANYSIRKFSDAVSASEKAASLQPDSMQANLLFGMCSRITKDFPNAEKALKRADTLAKGTSADAHWQLALLYGRDTNRPSEAAKELERYLELIPDAPNKEKEDVKKLIKQFKEQGKGTN